MLSESLGSALAELIMTFGGVFTVIMLCSLAILALAITVFIVIAKIIAHVCGGSKRVVHASFDDFTMNDNHGNARR